MQIGIFDEQTGKIGLQYGSVSDIQLNLVLVRTVIYFAKLELVGILKVIRLRNDFQPYRWTSWASRISGKMKKAQ